MTLDELMGRGWAALRREDEGLAGLLEREHLRQAEVLNLIAAAMPAHPSVLACQAATIGNVTAEGYPGARFHAGSAVADAVEELAIARARRAFGARHANVQPHSGSAANAAVLLALLEPGDAILGLALEAGGHLTHGAAVSFSGRLFRGCTYGLDEQGRLDLEQVRRVARAEAPRLIVAGASAYPRQVDFAAFRQIADEVGAYLLADISHVAGLVAAGLHPNPIDQAHVTTTSTYKQLGGPRGGLILMGRDHDSPALNGRDTLAAALDRAVFPLLQGTPSFGAIAAKARALDLVAGEGFRGCMRRVQDNARHLAERLAERGHAVCSGGTDNHLVLVETRRRGVPGARAAAALEACGIIVNKNLVPGDRRAASPGGIRLGTNSVACQGMGVPEMDLGAALVDEVLRALAERGSEGDFVGEAITARVRAEVKALCARFPLPGP